jgi:putative Ca2+/H+ antiporter (TMEM165/GDT1 family)
MGDKTQAATVVLAAQYQAYLHVVAGTTLGMLIANVPVVLLGGGIAKRLPVRAIHITVAVVFAILGVATLLGLGERLGF